jgi:hypothetical protein
MAASRASVFLPRAPTGRPRGFPLLPLTKGIRLFLLVVGLVPIDLFAFRAALQLVRRTVFIHETERLPIVLTPAPSRCS